ncbi:MAG: hypothetical protein V4801_10315 [Burkholderia gladioli]
MDREEVLTRLMTHELASSEARSLTDYVDLLGELERMLSDREMRVLPEMGARMLRATRPELFRMVHIDTVYPSRMPPLPGLGQDAANSPRA